MPVRRDHARQRVRDLRAQPRRPDLHEGHAPRAAGEADARRRPRPLRHADPLLQERFMSSLVLATSAGNVVVWIVWVVAGFSCLASGVAVISFSNPFYSALALIGNLASLAVMYLLLSAEFVAAAQVLVYAGAVVVMFLFVIAYVGPRREEPWSGGPSWQTVGAVAAAGALLVEIVVAISLAAGGSLGHDGAVGAGVRDAGVDRPDLPHRPPARLRDHLGRPARRGGRRRDPRRAHTSPRDGGARRHERTRRRAGTSRSRRSCSGSARSASSSGGTRSSSCSRSS